MTVKYQLEMQAILISMSRLEARQQALNLPSRYVVEQLPLDWLDPVQATSNEGEARPSGGHKAPLVIRKKQHTS